MFTATNCNVGNCVTSASAGHTATTSRNPSLRSPDHHREQARTNADGNTPNMPRIAYPGRALVSAPARCVYAAGYACSISAATAR